ncbi:hypothetical protein TELCIR_01922 [Teladorsagia circumcincta]|uniref:C-type lectin domain-containing protein n=1 Tax=Teladorsagia circumcincta TaxID=45464 RepID=A0A2G9V0L2_TELCI|nr:hypothetical protein TELCIR_01922 [Teladorsagia circumcincta]
MTRLLNLWKQKRSAILKVGTWFQFTALRRTILFSMYNIPLPGVGYVVPYQWNDIPCETEMKHFVCKKGIAPDAATTFTETVEIFAG